MTIDVKASLTYVFKDPNWAKKLLAIVGIQVIVAVLSQIIQIGGSMSGYLTELLPETSTSTISMVQVVSFITPIAVQFITALVTIPLQFYIIGYFMENRINVMNSVEHPLPENTNIMQKIYLGVMIMILSFLPTFLFMLLMIIPILLPVTLLALSIDSNDSLLVFSIFLLIAVIFLIIALSFVISLIIIPAMIYIYVTEGSFGAAWNFAKLSALLKAYWKNFALTGFLILALSMVAGMVTVPLVILTCGLGLLLSPLITIYVSAVESHIWGQQYREITQKGA